MSEPLTPKRVLEIITQNSLSIRQIPTHTYVLLEMNDVPNPCYEYVGTVNILLQGVKPWDTIAAQPDIVVKGDKVYRTLRKFKSFPNYAGYWMCQQVRHKESTVLWNAEEHCVAPTLTESVFLWTQTHKENT